MLHKLGFAGSWHRRWREAIRPRQIVWCKVLLGVQHLLPSDSLAGVCCFAAHDANERGKHHAVAVIDHLAFADGVEKRFVLQVVHVLFFATEAPAFRTVDDRARAFANGECALGALNHVHRSTEAALDLTGAEVAEDVVIPFVGGVEVVENVAGFSSNLSASSADACLRWLVAHRPAEFIDAVDGLFYDAIATEPGEVIPVAQLPLHIAPFRITGAVGWHRLNWASVVGSENAGDIADGTVLQALKGLETGGAIAPAKTCHEV